MSEREEPLWITFEQAIAIHSRQLRRFGGAPGLRDEGLLRSALERPVNKWSYEQAALPELAAAYAFGLAKNHAFVDGNKRVAAASMVMFVYLNDRELACDEDELVELTLGVATGTKTKAEIAVFLAARVTR